MSESSVPLRMMQMLSAYWTSMAIIVAAKLNLADHLRNGPMSAGDLAKVTQTHEPSLARLLRTLAAQGIFAEDEEGHWQLTPLANQLRSDVSGSQKALALMMGDEHYRSWGELEHSIRTGNAAFNEVYGKPIFEYLAERPEQAAIFDAAMVGVHGQESEAMCDAYDFSVFGTLVDVGGGNGSLVSIVLNRNQGVKGILYDLPHVVERAKGNIQKAGLAERCQLIGGSFFDSIPPGADAYMMRHIIHDWDDEKSLMILRNIRTVIPSTGKLLVVEGVVPAGNDPSFTKLLDLNMLVIPGGMERTEAEYCELYKQAGFQVSRIVPTRSEVSIIEGVPV